MIQILNLFRILLRNQDSAREIFKWLKNLSTVWRATASSEVFRSILKAFLYTVLSNPEISNRLRNLVKGTVRKSICHCRGGDDDRISKLPDEILHQILYFAGSRKAVQASVLSKRWRNLSASSPLINIDNREFSDTADSVEAVRRFFQKFMLLHDDDQSKLLRLRIFSVRLDIHEFEVCSRAATPHRFRYLRIIRLCKIVGWSGRDARFGVEMLPALEELCIALTLFKSLDIQTDKLKILKLWHCRALQGVIRVSAPNLQELDFRLIAGSRLCVEDDFSSLSHATVDISVDNKDGEAPSKMIKMFSTLHNAISLTVSSSTVEGLKLQHDFYKRLPNFRNLMRVVVMLDTSAQPIQIKKDLLQLWPNLKTLEVNSDWLKPEPEPEPVQQQV